MKYADYITKIEIDSLWSGKKHIVWSLDRRVNILSGVNGVGKSTILNKVVTPLHQKLAPGGVLAALEVCTLTSILLIRILYALT